MFEINPIVQLRGKKEREAVTTSNRTAPGLRRILGVRVQELLRGHMGVGEEREDKSKLEGIKVTLHLS